MADLAGNILICKRPYYELHPHNADEHDCRLVNCCECQTPIYAMRKNMDRGLLLLCVLCATKIIAGAAKEGEPVVFIPGESIGSEQEDDVHQAAVEMEQLIKSEMGTK